MKKITKLVFMLTCVFTLAVFTKTEVNAATKIPTNAWVDIEADTDTYPEYTFKMPKGAYFQVEFTNTGKKVNKDGEEKTSSAHFSLRITSDNVALGKMIVGSNNTKTTDYYQPAAGQTVTVMVHPGVTGGKNTYYGKMRIVLKRPTRFETEDNNTQDMSDRISGKATYNGLIAYHDTDWYVFKASKNGKAAISVTNLSESSHNLYAYVYDGNNKLLETVKIPAGNGNTKIYANSNIKKGRKIYVKIVGGNGSYKNDFYKIKVTGTAA